MEDGVPSEVEALLTSDPVVAHLATAVDDRPHVAPVWYRYDDGVVEFTTTGKKLENVRENPRVALSIQRADGGRPEWLVTLRGTATVVEDEAENREATERINRKYGVEPDAWSENTLVRVDVGSVSHQTY